MEVFFVFVFGLPTTNIINIKRSDDVNGKS